MLSDRVLPITVENGRFDDAAPLGAGSSGLVFSVFDHKRRERVALKRLHAVTAQSVRTLKAEFRSVAEIFHPNLVVLHELFGAEEQWFFTMQLIEGTHLSPPLGAALREEALRNRLLQLAAALVAVHEAGFTHRDVKPSNVMVSRDEHVTLLDFGLLRESRRPGGEGTLLSGSPAYAAPEQILGNSVGPEADWYAFGSVLYELLAGATPYPYPTTEVLSRKLREDPAPVASLSSGLPEDLCDLCMALLSRDPARRPTGTEVISHLDPPVSGVVPVSFGPGVRPPLAEVVGRTREIELIDEALMESPAEPVLILLDGRSGIGKTTIGEMVLRRAEQRGALVLKSRCHALESVPFNGWDGIIDELAELVEGEFPALRGFIDPELAQIFPVLRDDDPADVRTTPPSGDPAEMRTAAFASLRRLFEALTRDRDVLLFFDDLHWADRDSVRLLHDLLRAGGDVPLRAVATARRKEFPESSIASSCRSGQWGGVLREVEVRPLEEEASKSLLRPLSLSEPELDAIIGQAAGDPYLLQEFARVAVRSPGMSREEPTSIQNLVRSRLDQLMPDQREIIEVISLFGRPIPISVAAAAAGIEGTPTTILAPLRAAGFLRLSWGDGMPELEAYHHRVRDAVTEQLSPSRRHDIHAALCDVLVRESFPDSEAIAICAAGAGRRRVASNAARRTAEEAKASLAFARAAQWYQKVVDWEEPQGEELRLLSQQIGEMAEAAGDGTQAARAYRQALRLLPETVGHSDQRIHLQRRVAHSLLMSGQAQTGEDVLRSLLKAIGRHLPDSNWSLVPRLMAARMRLRLRGLALKSSGTKPLSHIDALDVACVCYVHLDPMRAWLLSTWQLQEALDCGDEKRVLQALANELIFASAEGEPGISWSSRVLAAGERLVSDVQDERVKAWFDYARSLHAVLLGNFGESLRHAEAAELRLTSRCRGAYWELENLRRGYVGAVQLDGDMVAPEPSLRQWLASAEERGDDEGVASHLVGLAYAACSHDRGERALSMIRRARSLVRDPDGDLTLSIDWAEAFVLCYRPPDPAALAACYGRLKTLRHRPQRFVQLFRIWAAGYASRVATSLALHGPRGERASWISAIRREQALLEKERTELAAFMSSQAEAAVAYLGGNVDRAIRMLKRRVDLAEKKGLGLFAASAGLVAASHSGDESLLNESAERMRAFHVKNPVAMAQAHVALPLAPSSKKLLQRHSLPDG